MLINMFMKNIYFLSGLPRSGSTVLAGILNQHPDIHASSTSGLLDMLVGTVKAWSESLSVKASAIDKINSEKEIQRILQSICMEKYAKINKPIILDKFRGWVNPTNMKTMANVLGKKPKIIATVRNIPDCVSSMVRIAKPNNLYEFLQTSELVKHIKDSYELLSAGYSFAPECILFVDYDDLINDPKKQLDRIHTFLELPAYDGYDFNKIDGTNLRENDEVWTVKGLHDIKPVLAKQHNNKAEDVLGRYYTTYQQTKFWLGEKSVNKPPQDIDLQLEAGLIGNFIEGNRLGEKIAKEEPWNNRAAFNRGWYEMWKGNLLEGHKLLYRGRLEKVFGNEPPQTPTPMWDGVSKGTVLLNLEGGLGDQIHCSRFAKNIAERGCEVIIASSGEIAPLFRNIKGVVAVVQHEAVFGVIHDFWVPSMSSPLLLNMEYKDVDGSPYITLPKNKTSKKMRIGLRWQGNPNFEHQQHRIFPPNKLFNAVKNSDVEFISLQRDEGAEYKPNWVTKVPLVNWGNTAEAIGSCDLVITSCTSVAHLAAAAGIPTWIIVPILPYYLWAKPGNTTEWYDTVKLYRQSKHGDWDNVFDDIKKDLNAILQKDQVLLT